MISSGKDSFAATGPIGAELLQFSLQCFCLVYSFAKRNQPMNPSQTCKSCHGTGKVKDRSSGKEIRCTSCGGTGIIVTAMSG
jgi:DnaJ-class molecular chaperone